MTHPVEENYRFFAWMARRYIKQGSGPVYEEILQSGLVEAVRVSQYYSPRKGKFTTYAYKPVNAAMSQSYKHRTIGAAVVGDRIEHEYGSWDGDESITINQIRSKLPRWLEKHRVSPVDRALKLFDECILGSRQTKDFGKEFGLTRGGVWHIKDQIMKAIRKEVE